ncbi:hypothetical protein ACVIW2_007296 [Bradyrhizobium huanghuaihaiense]|uniref:DUF6798 domain-containing protein n=1 Tax=Bradyrhizobium huanghuaihaiense TaxID=990078 RepID=A0A562RWJ7_9BRAD|nr:DUF6798 domain-containing protein [Bradyrhizobium huanghuaihaiense]TWI72696.1 hypothetical protein IQ16_02274 [Bradyrhizobium huanghuaihaiense]
MADVNVTSDMIGRDRAVGASNFWVEIFSVAVFASAVSVLRTGFVFGLTNNLYHLPIVAGLYNEPQYADDRFIQSLRYFASGVWLILSGVERYFDNVPLLFLVLFFLSRLLSFVGFLCCASLLGITEQRDRIVFSLILCFVAFLDGYSYAGSGGLFINTFTHSEMANGVALLAIYFAARGRFTAAAIAVGITFFINAFFAVWLVLPLALIGIHFLLQRNMTIGELSSRVLIGLALCLPLAFAVLYGFLANPEFGRPFGIDYADFLRQYFPGHMLIDSMAPSEIVGLLAVTAIGALAFFALRQTAAELRVAYVGAILVYLIGVVVPFVTRSPFILNLHFLRSSTVIHLLAGLAIAALATKWLRRGKDATFLPTCLIVLFLSFDGWGSLAFVVAALVYALRTMESGPAPSYQRATGHLVLAATVFVAYPFAIRTDFNFNRICNEAIEEWGAVGAWARNNTPLNAMFLTPRRPGLDGSEVSTADMALDRASVFEYVSHRRVWIDHKRGGTSMWMPSYYQTWRSRLTDVDGLNSLDERLAYASRNGIGYVIDICQGPDAQSGALYRTKRLCVFSAGASEPTARKDASSVTERSPG